MPLAEVTVTGTEPGAGTRGLTTTTCVSLTTDRPVAGVEPNSTWVAPLRADPVRVTSVPPATLPLDGKTPLSWGATSAA